MSLNKEAIEQYQQEGYTPEEIEAINKAASEALSGYKPVLMEGETGRFRRVKTVFDIPTETGRLLWRLFHNR